MIGFIVQVLLLVILAATTGLGVAGWVTGLGYGLVMCAALTLGLRRAGTFGFGPADWVTLARATLVGCVAALTVDSAQRPAPAQLLVAIASVALVLDALDGQVARRTGTVSGLGARFDGEIDAVLILVLSVYVGRSMGAWVLAIGTMRYVFAVAGWALPWLRGPLPPRFWRKVVAATQGVVLAFVAADVLPAALQVAALVAALALLVESFGRDIAWRWRHGTSGRAARPLTERTTVASTAWNGM